MSCLDWLIDWMCSANGLEEALPRLAIFVWSTILIYGGVCSAFVYWL